MSSPSRETVETLLEWYAQQGRNLPWRETRDPYKIWVIETILQQTQISQAQAYIHRFLERFPTLDALAGTSLEAILEVWQGLGYYRRALHLHQTAQQIVSAGGWTAVQSQANPLHFLESLPGIGPYTARAILSFTGWAPYLPVDGNLVRVLSRLWGLSSRDRRLYQTKADALPEYWRKREIAFALMDLARLLCLPRRPKCLLCPLASTCVALQRGTPEQYPPAYTPRPKPTRSFMLTLCANKEGVWLQKQPLGGLWSGLWSLPMQATDAPMVAQPTLTHEFTHFRLVGYVHRQAHPPDDAVFVSWAHLAQYGLPAPIRRLLAQEAKAQGFSFSVEKP
ncbi:MAG: A/G-specific adenine glycosylase [Bacteroidia bacterium]|nr:A/G-specific adenine glycosylase [Bacteroidia bacterium]